MYLFMSYTGFNQAEYAIHILVVAPQEGVNPVRVHPNLGAHVEREEQTCVVSYPEVRGLAGLTLYIYIYIYILDRLSYP